MQDFDIGKSLADLLPSADDKHLRSITGFQLKDLVSGSYSIDDLKEGIKKRLEINNDKDIFNQDPRIIADEALDDKKEEEETEEEKHKRWGDPKVTLKEILTEFDLVEETKEKIEKEDITDDIIWHVDVNEFVEKLELKSFKK